MTYQPPLSHPVFYNGTALNTQNWQTGTDGVAITGISGWFDAPDVRDVRQENPGRDGEFADNLFLGGRTIVVEGLVSGSSYADLQTKKLALTAKLVPSSSEYVFKLPLPSNSSPSWTHADSMVDFERVSARVVEGVQFGEADAPLLQPFVVTLRASDPRIYNDVETTTTLTTAGGLTGTITNTGTYNTPAYTGFKVVSGAGEGFVTTNQTNSTKSSAFYTTFLDPGEELNIDARTRTAELKVAQYDYRTDALTIRTLLKLNETSGTTATDAGLNALNWTYAGTPTLNQTGPFTGSASVAFDGVNDEATRAYNAAYNRTVFTMEGWIKPNGVQIGGLWDWANNTTNGWALNVKTGSAGSSHEFQWRGATGLNIIGTIITTGWIHIALVRNYNLWEFYINGQRASSWVASITNITSGTYRLGRTIFASSNAWFIGNMSSVGFYNVALRSDQIKPLYQSGSVITAPGSQYVDFANTTWMRLDPGANSVATATPFAGSGTNDFTTTVKHRDARL